jgi:hypothetical protein
MLEIIRVYKWLKWNVTFHSNYTKEKRKKWKAEHVQSNCTWEIRKGRKSKRKRERERERERKKKREEIEMQLGGGRTLGVVTLLTHSKLRSCLSDEKHSSFPF